MIIKTLKKIKRTILRVYYFFREKKRSAYIKRNFDFAASSVTILSNNCVGGLVYREMNLEYQSPTIFTNFLPTDFCKYVLEFERYDQLEIVEAPKNYDLFHKLGVRPEATFPCGIIGDIPVLFQHEKNFTDAKQKWERRSKRVNFHDIVVIVYVDKQLITKELLELFHIIDYPKILLTNTRMVSRFPNCHFVRVPKKKEWWEYGHGRIRYFERFPFRKFFKDVCGFKRRSDVC